MKKTILVAALTTIATMFLVFLVCHLFRCHNGCGGQSNHGQAVHCSSSYSGGGHGKCASYSSCSSKSSCSSASSCRSKSKCSKAKKCCKSKSSCSKGVNKTCKWTSKDGKQIKIIKKKIVVEEKE